MPIDPKTKFRIPSGLSGDWTAQRVIQFWHSESPLPVKFAIEKMTASLLRHDPEFPDQPVYICPNAGALGRTHVRLKLEAVFPTRRLYSLTLSFKAPRNWVDEDEFVTENERVTSYWSSRLQLAAGDIPWSEASPELLAQEVQATLDAEARAALEHEDPIAIAALQQRVLAAVRAGRIFYMGHKEGTIVFRFNGSSFERRDEGENPDYIRFASDEDFLKAIRNFYDWESRRDTYPHYPPETSIWQIILNKLTD